MLIIGCDFHPGFQQLAIFDKQTGEIRYRRVKHVEEAREFYRGLEEPALVGMEACGFTLWFEELLAEQGHELRMGDAAKIRASVVRRQKTDQRDAEHMLTLLLENRFPQIWVASPEERDARQLLMHRHGLVRMRTQTMNQLHAIALNRGVQKKYQLWTKTGRELLEQLALPAYTAQRRGESLRRLQYLDEQIRELSRQVEAEVAKRPEAQLLRTHPGVGPITALGLC